MERRSPPREGLGGAVLKSGLAYNKTIADIREMNERPRCCEKRDLSPYDIIPRGFTGFLYQLKSMGVNSYG